MDGAALWLAEHADEIGARAPNSDERARAMGVYQYSRDLGLDAHAMAAALGNTFDKDLVGLRLEAGLLKL
eukprot:9211837-Alexandrium_andersonii.AAC.1